MMGNDYGTSRKLVLNEFDKGKNVIIQTEPDRAAQIKRNMPEAVCILVYPFDSGILKTRYTEKARSSFEVSVRTEVALKQINSSKLFCDREVDSGDADKACKEIISIINGN
jgi:guanylate kinase